MHPMTYGQGRLGVSPTSPWGVGQEAKKCIVYIEKKKKNYYT